MKCITIINDDKQSLNALKLFFDSMRINSPDLYHQSWYVIFPSGFEENLSMQMKNVFAGIRFIPYTNAFPEDKYALKFSLKDFLENECDDKEAILYLDTDHIFLKTLELGKLEEDEILFSSEMHELVVKQYGKINHYNTSLIYGFTNSLQKLFCEWIVLYHELDDSEVGRFKEEVAMSIVADKLGLRVKNASAKVQSNFQVFDCSCSIFHYGGEYGMAKSLKKYLSIADF